MKNADNVQQPTVVPFHGQDLITIQDGDTVSVAMRPICDAIGLQWEAQHKRIKRDEVLSTCMSVMDMQLPGDTQRRNVITLPLDMLNGWLFGVEAKRVKPEIRDRLITYKFECYQALASYWQVGVAINPRAGKTSVKDRAPLKQLVNTIVDVRTRKGLPSDYSMAWREVNSHLGIESITDATHDQVEQGIIFARQVLEGELLEGGMPAESLTIDAPRAKHWTEYTVGELIGEGTSHSEISKALNTLRQAARSGAHVSVADMEAIEQEVMALRHVTDRAIDRIESMTTNLGCVQRHADIAERTWTGTIGPAVAMFDQALSANMREHLGVLSRLLRYEIQRPRLAFAS